ncbi:MAG: alkaline phosphatase family protein [Thermoprotei archaeon]
MVRTLLIVILVAFFLFASTVPSNDTATPIKHVVIVIDENHSFDNLFGVYPFGWPPIVNNITTSVMRPQGLYTNYSQLESSNNGTISSVSVPRNPLDLSEGYAHPYYAWATSTEDPAEGWGVYHDDYLDNTTEGFVAYSGPQSMAYFSYEQLAPLWDYAEEYVLADNYYAPVLGLTEPNRVAYLVGYPPAFRSDSALSVVPFHDTLMYQLSESNVSWGYYVYGFSSGVPWPLTAFSGVGGYTSHIHPLSDFYAQLRGGLPSVSWVMFLGGNTSEYDMHPPYNVSTGAYAFTQVVNAVMNSVYADSTVIFFTFDEGGGYYDQVVPPTIGSFGLGQRIPLLIISPLAKEGWVDNYTLSGYSLIGFVEYNWHLPYLTALVANSNIQGLLAAFNFTAPPRQPLILTPENWTYPIPLQYPIHYGYTATLTTTPGVTRLASNNQPPNTILLLVPITIGLTLAVISLLTRRRVKAYR